MKRVGSLDLENIRRRIRACDYLSVAQLYLRDNFLLKRPLEPADIKPRLLGHWGTCHGINVAYANLKEYYKDDENFSFVLGPGHGFPALQANLFLDGELEKVDKNATVDAAGVAYICKNFSWPDGFPSHASPFTPGIITEGGELGYALANAYGVALGHPEKTLAVLIGDGELETATAIDSLNLHDLMDSDKNGRVLPILHLNGYKISAPSIYARKSERELNELVRGFGFTPITID
ncbi:phosphoketolase family protein, partial [Candidatus Saccharibacteria bacterium]|nr:phosphoketolase family protein [Candidatus Saccharibacteria bacterium]